MIQRLLIANRGEIACRIIETAKRLGIETVAVYSQADRGARHVRIADLSHPIGPAPAKDSYLNIERILEAAEHTRADAIHPGYGFLAERGDFARQVSDKGLIFIGPNPDTIDAMGSKARAKALVEAAGVLVIPGYRGDDQSDETLFEKAQDIGFPLMIKAAAGGGGKGMRTVLEGGEFIAHLQAARREAMAAFGDDEMILERYLSHPRHIEAQIFGDQHGQVIHLYERDCSSQRRCQKIIEEAPAVGLSEALRHELLHSAVSAAQAVNYVGAGTVEFLVDPQADAFYFLEMNTRLQVEHPVTEMITGLDLVEWQLKVASGEKLPRQDDIAPPQGHAFEARLYAEDPDQGFLPAVGRIQALAWPEAARIDTGVDAGDAIGIDYDPMIAKLIVHGPTRTEALTKLTQALEDTFIDGLTTNLGFLQTLSACQPMQHAQIDTGFLDRSLETLLAQHSSAPQHAWFVAAALWAEHSDQNAHTHQPNSPWGQSTGWRMGLLHQPRVVKLVRQNQSDALLVKGDGGDYLVCQDNEWHEINLHAHQRRPSSAHCTTHWQVQWGDRAFAITSHLTEGGRIEFSMNAHRYAFTLPSANDQQALNDGAHGQLTSPMPGQIVSVHVSEDQAVKTGEVLAIIEAMKMEISIKAPIDGVVKALHATPGLRVDANAVLIEIEPSE